MSLVITNDTVKEVKFNGNDILKVKLKQGNSDPVIVWEKVVARAATVNIGFNHTRRFSVNIMGNTSYPLGEVSFAIFAVQPPIGNGSLDAWIADDRYDDLGGQLGTAGIPIEIVDPGFGYKPGSKYEVFTDSRFVDRPTFRNDDNIESYGIQRISRWHNDGRLFEYGNANNPQAYPGNPSGTSFGNDPFQIQVLTVTTSNGTVSSNPNDVGGIDTLKIMTRSGPGGSGYEFLAGAIYQFYRVTSTNIYGHRPVSLNTMYHNLGGYQFAGGGWGNTGRSGTTGNLVTGFRNNNPDGFFMPGTIPLEEVDYTYLAPTATNP